MKRILLLIVILFLISGIALGTELGAGEGTSYPTTIDTDVSVEVDYPDPDATTARAAVPNDTNAAVIAIETELGINPSGAYDTVRARLDAGDGLYYLKTEIDTLSELEAIYIKDIIDSDELAALKFTDLADTPVNYTGQAGKYTKVNAGETALEFGTPTGAGTYLELTDTPAAYEDGKYAKSTADGMIWDDPAGAGDMTKAVYDTDTDNIVDKAETVDDGVGNSSTAMDVKDAVTKKHNQNTDTALGTQTQDLNMGTHKIIGVVDPINPQEAATKAYADTKVATEVDPTVDTDVEIKAILVDEVTKTGDFTAGRLPEINNSSGIIEQSDIEHKANGGYDFNANSAGFTTQTATGDGTTTCDWRIGLKYRFVFGAQNETFTFTNPEFSCHLQIIMIQNGTGNRTATWPAGIFWAGGTIPTLSTAANARDTVNFFFDDYDDVYYGMGIDFAIP